MSTTTRPMTADEFLMLPDDGMRHELVRGELTTMPLPGAEHGSVTMTISALLWTLVKPNRLGKLYASTGMSMPTDSGRSSPRRRAS